MAHFATEADYERFLASRGKNPAQGKHAQALPIPEKRRGRMNSLETRYATEVLGPRMWAREIEAYWFEPIRFRMAKSTNFTPDFVVQTPGGWEIHEVKGHKWQAGMVRLKTCAEMAPMCLMFKFYLCKYVSGEWVIERVG